MAHATLIEALAHHAAHTPQAIALHFEGHAIRYHQLWQRIAVATDALAQRGIGGGQRVAYLGLNDPALIVLLCALQRLGAICLPLNYRLAPAELSAILHHAQAGWLVHDAAHADAAAHLLPSGPPGLRLLPAHHLSEGSHAAPALAASAHMGNAATPALLVYTSGTTGQPKGALHTQGAMVANCLMSAHAHGLRASDHILTALPLFHVGGLCIQTLPALYAGATVTLLPRFEPGAWLAAVQQQRPSLSLMVPATLGAVLAHPRFASTDLSCLRMLSAGSSTIPLSLITPWHARGIPVGQIYGTTETGPVSIYLQAHQALAHLGSTGQAGPGVDVRLVSPQGSDVPPGSVGELWIRGPNVMLQYWHDANHPAFQDGWFRTGDLACQDAQGFTTIVGRCKDMIISGGENIYPAELENLLANCPAIAECAVLGQADPQWGEVAVAVVVRQPNASLSASEVLQLFHGQLAKFKHPRRIVFVDSLPKTATGKVQKSALLAHLQKLPAKGLDS